MKKTKLDPDAAAALINKIALLLPDLEGGTRHGLDLFYPAATVHVSTAWDKTTVSVRPDYHALGSKGRLRTVIFQSLNPGTIAAKVREFTALKAEQERRAAEWASLRDLQTAWRTEQSAEVASAVASLPAGLQPRWYASGLSDHTLHFNFTLNGLSKAQALAVLAALDGNKTAEPVV